MSRRVFVAMLLGLRPVSSSMLGTDYVRDGWRRFGQADATIEAAVRRGEIPGAVLHVRAHGRVVHERAFGRQQIRRNTPVAPDDLFPVASLTKPVVAAGVLQLCEAGTIWAQSPSLLDALHADEP